MNDIKNILEIIISVITIIYSVKNKVIDYKIKKNNKKNHDKVINYLLSLNQNNISKENIKINTNVNKIDDIINNLISKGILYDSSCKTNPDSLTILNKKELEKLIDK